MGQETTDAKFRANMTAWLYEYAKKHISNHSRVYSSFQLDIGPEAFKRALCDSSESRDHRCEEDSEDD